MSHALNTLIAIIMRMKEGFAKTLLEIGKKCLYNFLHKLVRKGTIIATR